MNRPSAPGSAGGLSEIPAWMLAKLNQAEIPLKACHRHHQSPANSPPAKPGAEGISCQENKLLRVRSL